MPDANIRISGRTGRITLNRPDALNALTYGMCLAIERAFDDWRDDPSVACVVLDAAGEKAFCAGGDIAELYRTGKAGDFEYGQRFWADEYRLNAKIYNYPKPVVSFLQGFVMGGGVGLGCHGTHRIVGDSSRIAMPECGIGLIPDVGGSFLLASAPGRLGEYLGTTGTRMGPADAIHAGFADLYVPQGDWPDLITRLESDGAVGVLDKASRDPGESPLSRQGTEIDAHFAGENLSDVLKALRASRSPFAAEALKALERGSPLSISCTLELLQRLRGPSITLEKALELEYRFTSRAMAQGDFLEGIRAAIIDKDRKPRWQFPDRLVPATAVSRMLMPVAAA